MFFFMYSTFKTNKNTTTVIPLKVIIISHWAAFQYHKKNYIRYIMFNKKKNQYDCASLKYISVNLSH